MTPNTVELFQPESSRLAVPATTTLVLVDGTVCGRLAPLEIVRGAWPDFGWARLVYHPDAVEQIEERFGMGRSVCLQQLYNDRSPQTGTSGLTLFSGHIETVETTIDAAGERVEILARDFSAVLERITVYGRHVRQDSGRIALVAGLDTTFNPNGQGNASPQPVAVAGQSYTAFAAESAGARLWTCAEAIGYLLCQYLPSGALLCPDPVQLEAVTDHQLVRDLDVTGLSLLEALHRCCEPAGLAFRFVPCPRPNGPSQMIVFYRNGRGRTAELNCQPRGEALNLARTNVATLRSKRQRWPVTHRYIGQGDFKVYEATFDLVKAWDPALEGTDLDAFSPSTNPDFHEVKDVYRKWCLNEAGDYTAAPYNQGEPFDLAAVFAGADYVRRRRRFWPALTANAQGGSLGYRLEMSNDGGLTWSEYAYAFDNLLDECGIWLSSDRLDMDTWVAAQRDRLTFRLTASIVSDERLTAIVADGPLGSTSPVIDHMVTLPRQFRYRKVSAQSAFAPVGPTGGVSADEVDDSAALREYVRRLAAASAPVFETLDVQTLGLALHLQPGDRVTSSPDSRDLLGSRRDVRSLFWIAFVRLDFVRQCTRLTIARCRF